MELRAYQVEALTKIRGAYRRGKRSVLVVSPTGCHERGTKILMHDGTLRNVEDVVIGDNIMGPDSMPRRVLSLHRGTDEMYVVKPVKGEPFVVNGGHILSLKRTNDGTSFVGSVCDVSVSGWLFWSRTKKHIHKLFRSGCNFPEKNAAMKIDPYFLGVLLGDGCMARSVQITTPDKEIADFLQDQAKEWGGLRRRMSVKPGNKASAYFLSGVKGVENPIAAELKNLGLWGCLADRKFVPQKYKVASFDDRLKILAGLIDTDGHIYESGCEYVTKSKQLCEDVKFIARSLGFAAYSSEKTIAKYENFIYYRVNISGDLSVIPTKVKHKKTRERRQKKDVLVTGFSIIPKGLGCYYGFTVDSDNRYLMGDFTVTHNSGKGVILAKLIHNATEKGSRVLFLVHRREILFQVSAHMDRLGIPHGVIMASEVYEYGHPVDLATVQTIHRRLKTHSYDMADLIIVDEAHHCTAATYLEIINSQKKNIVVGFTATPCRKTGHGLGHLFDELVNVATIAELTSQGYLVPVRYFAPSEPDLKGIKVVGGDYVEKALEGIMLAPKLVGDVVENWARLGEGRQTVVFTTTVAHSVAVCDAFNAAGIPADHVDGRTNSDERDETLRRFRNGDTRVLCNCQVFTEGVDIPDIACVVMARPTKSLALYMQTIGRGMRPANGKSDLVFIDHAGACYEHGPVHEICEWELDDKIRNTNKENEERKERNSRPITCEICSCVYTGQLKCPECQHIPDLKRQRKGVEYIDANLGEVCFKTKTAKPKPATAEEKQRWYSELIGYAKMKGYQDGWISHKYRSKFGCWPRGQLYKQAPPSAEVLAWVRGQAARHAIAKANSPGRREAQNA